MDPLTICLPNGGSDSCIPVRPLGPQCTNAGAVTKRPTPLTDTRLHDADEEGSDPAAIRSLEVPDPVRKVVIPRPR